MANIFYDLVTLLRPKKQYTVSKRAVEEKVMKKGVAYSVENIGSTDRGMERIGILKLILSCYNVENVIEGFFFVVNSHIFK